MRLLLTAVLALGLVGFAGQAQEQKKDVKKEVKKAPPVLPATTASIKYGSHERQVMDFWQAKSEKPTPVYFYIHGGGWQGGDKNSVGAQNIKACLDAGISVAAINYRYVAQAVKEGVTPPVKAPLHDAARALQTLRSKATEWNIDKKRIGATGGSAGACSSLWLAFHDDMADPKSTDPIARESTRLYCAAVNGAQVSLDAKQNIEWIPNYKYGAHAFGMKDLKEVVEKRAELMPWIKEYSPIELVTKDDPPVALFYGEPTNPKMHTEQKDPTHSALLGMALEARCKEIGVECILVYPSHPHSQYKSTTEYLVDRLRK
jgi:acetyl esterase/lipase